VDAGEALLDELLELARAAALEGGRVAMDWRGSAALEIREKAASDDLVSQADEDAERAIRQVLARARPGDGVTGEEQGARAGGTGITWLVDPIDGTTSYLYGRSDWSVSVAAAREADGQILAGAVMEPVLGLLSSARLGGGTLSGATKAHCSDVGDLSRALVELNFGRPEQRGAAGATVDGLLPHVRDIRRSGSAAAALAHVATGRADAYWGPGLRDWDVAAGVLLVSEAGGEVGDRQAQRAPMLRGNWDLLASAPGLHASLRELLPGV
jgi:myo-inositol-1(or 4)-monophosphatase